MKLELILVLVNLVFGLDIKTGLTKIVEKSKERLMGESVKLIQKAAQEVKSGVDRVKKTLDMKEYMKQWRLDNKEKTKDYNKQYHLKNREKL